MKSYLKCLIMVSVAIGLATLLHIGASTAQSNRVCPSEFEVAKHSFFDMPDATEKLWFQSTAALSDADFLRVERKRYNQKIKADPSYNLTFQQHLASLSEDPRRGIPKSMEIVADYQRNGYDNPEQISQAVSSRDRLVYAACRYTLLAKLTDK